MSSEDTPSLHEVSRHPPALACFSRAGRSTHPGTPPSQESLVDQFLHVFASANAKVQTFLVDTVVQFLDQVLRLFTFRCEQSHYMCCRQSHFLAFSSRLCDNDTVQRNHQMSLDPRHRLPAYLSPSTLLLSQAPLPMQIPQGIFQMSVSMTV